jgi:lipopolysaccharide/colanic/teichoic acid biosynthesis glycosyltransferase
MPEPTTMTLVGTGFTAMTVQFFRRNYMAAKPYFDRTAAVAMLVFFAPIIAACALLVKLTSPGAIFYTQERVGKDGVVFEIIKIRTMRIDAEAKSGPAWSTGKSDPRMTQIGKILRATHLDELPQLINVIRGEMSLVGPRPERPHFVEKLTREIPEYDLRLKVRPGITGLAQTRAGADRELRDVRRKIKLDTMYIRRMCWWVDFIIMARTVRKFAGKE